MLSKLNTIELFAGCGGLVDGFEKTDKYRVLACVEWNKEPYEVLKKRLINKYNYQNVDEKVIRFDIQRSEELLNGWKEDINYGTGLGLKCIVGNNKVDLIIGGPPCQAYSLAGRIQDPNGMKEDYRNYLFESYLEIVKEFKPKIFVFENVEGILSAKPDGFSIIEQIKSDFSKSGYHIIDDIRKNALIDFSEYGVPQKRKRVILVGLNKDYFDFPEEVLNEFYQKILPNYKEDRIKTIKDAIGDLQPFYPIGEEIKIGKKKFSHQPDLGGIPQHEPRYHNKRDISIFEELAFDIESGKNKYSGIKALQELYTLKTGKTSNIHKYNVLRWGSPSNTIPAHLKKDGLRHIHPDSRQARSITVREAARIQTFDDDFEFSGTMSKDFEMIGNAVPPEFSRRLAEAIFELIREQELK